MKSRIMLITAILFSGTLAFGQQKDTNVVKPPGDQLTNPVANKGHPNLKLLIAPVAPSDSRSSTSKSSSSCEGAAEIMKKRKSITIK